jgi:hypothetical protein
LTRKKPKTIDELFHELEEYILSDDDHRWTKRSTTREQRSDVETSIPESSKHQHCGKPWAQSEQ